MPTIAVCNGTARTSKYIIEIGLEKGYNIKALVRSSKRFYEQYPKHPNLSAHEWSNFDDVSTLSELLKGVSTFFVVLGPLANEPTSLNQDCVQSASAALRLNLPAGATKSPTKIVLLSSAGVNPDLAHNAFVRLFSDNLLGNQMADLSRAQAYLRKQEAWLPSVIACPGAILDSEEPPSKKTEFRIAIAESPREPITYQRLAAAMFAASEEAEEKWQHKYLVPLPTTKVKTRLRDYDSVVRVFGYFFRTKVFPVVFRGTIFGVLCAGLGYYAGLKEQGAWVAANLGLDLR